VTASGSIQERRGTLDGDDHRYALIVARFNPMVTEELLQGAISGLLEHGVEEGAIEVVRVPGAWELPPAAARVLERGGVDAVIALGCVIRGETPHFEFVAGEAASGLGRLAVESGVPVIFGVLTTDTLEQALRRAGSIGDEASDNKGWEAAIAAIEMVNLYRSLG
jgi:6,7-dimethyl-8-ribityllumazine synthase